MEANQNIISEKKNLILATTSPYRLGIFKNLGIDFVSE
jgi:predicted house-cleaning NTP pyrophosphatase (Maf/HAM1 superfamily)